ncbi:hypothetical protein [Acetobacterium malicum]|uniref:hypothetical protein n=1 Tax=Acetobacterium malicum TaxID=52692 RepID=UPI0035948C9C
MNKNLSLSYIVLITVVIVCGLTYFVGPNNSVSVPSDFKEAIAFNLGISVVTILITVFLIDRVIERNKQNEIAKINKIAFNQIRIPILHQNIFLFNIFKATVFEEVEIKKMKPESLFNDFYFENIKYVDLIRVAPVLPKMTWLEYINLEIVNFRKTLEKTIDRYGSTLPTKFIEECESIINSSFCMFIN